jgi:hypothetical protein
MWVPGRTLGFSISYSFLDILLISRYPTHFSISYSFLDILHHGYEYYYTIYRENPTPWIWILLYYISREPYTMGMNTIILYIERTLHHGYEYYYTIYRENPTPWIWILLHYISREPLHQCSQQHFKKHTITLFDQCSQQGTLRTSKKSTRPF